MLSQLFLGGVLAASLPQAVLGTSFSVPFQKVTVPGYTTLPSVSSHRSGTASTREFDQEV
jgi:hypothetical protein